MFLLQRCLDEDCITELAVHYGKSKTDMEKDVAEVSNMTSKWWWGWTSLCEVLTISQERQGPDNDINTYKFTS